MITKEKIIKLRPKFYINDVGMVDWFQITDGGAFFCIRSGLRHPDGETKSPYHYEECIGGNNAEMIALEKFNKWWDLLDEKLKQNI